jgi:hypothetical protein
MGRPIPKPPPVASPRYLSDEDGSSPRRAEGEFEGTAGVPSRIADGAQVKIGRQTNNKTAPGEQNAFFDSKVLSRTHAEIWEQGGKVGRQRM